MLCFKSTLKAECKFLGNCFDLLTEKKKMRESVNFYEQILYHEAGEL